MTEYESKVIALLKEAPENYMFVSDITDTAYVLVEGGMMAFKKIGGYSGMSPDQINAFIREFYE